jgi:hypothetical protein
MPESGPAACGAFCLKDRKKHGTACDTLFIVKREFLYFREKIILAET